MHPAILEAVSKLERGETAALRRLMKQPWIAQCETKGDICTLAVLLSGTSERKLTWLIAIDEFAERLESVAGAEVRDIDRSKLDLLRKLEPVVGPEILRKTVDRIRDEKLTVRTLAAVVDQAIVDAKPGLAGGKMLTGAAAARDFELLAKRFVEQNYREFWNFEAEIVNVGREDPVQIDFYLLSNGRMVAGFEAVFARKFQRLGRMFERAATHALLRRSLEEIVCIFSTMDEMGPRHYRRVVEEYGLDGQHVLLLGHGSPGKVCFELHRHQDACWTVQSGEAAV